MSVMVTRENVKESYTEYSFFFPEKNIYINKLIAEGTTTVVLFE